MLLEKLLAGLDVGVEPFAVCDVRGDSHLALEASDTATVHYALAGAGTIRIAGGPAIDARAHTFMVVPSGVRQRIEARGSGIHATVPALACSPMADGLEHISAGCGEHGLVIACGAISATYRQGKGLFDYLREPIVEDFTNNDPIRGAFETLLAELAAPQPGTDALSEALMKQCLVLLLRQHCARGECRVSWLSALEDPRLGAAVTAMLDDPGAPFTLDRLANIAGMSRSAFTMHFADAFGRSAMDFLKELRLRRAANTLANTKLPVKTVAKSVGYASRSYFSRAFKAFYGIGPAGFRATGAA
jgi:AraC-like DNA-binding protein